MIDDLDGPFDFESGDDDEIDPEEMPDPGLYVITLTVDHEDWNPTIDFGGAPMFLVRSLLQDTLETLSLIAPPVTVASDGDLIFSPYCDCDDE